MKRKSLKTMLFITLSALLMAGCSTKEEAANTDSTPTVQATEAPTTDSVLSTAKPTAAPDPTETPTPTEAPAEELTRLGGDEYIDRLFIKLAECETYQNEDFFYRENAMGELVRQLKLFDFIKDVIFSTQPDKTTLIKFTYYNDMPGSYHIDHEFTEDELALYEDWNVIENLIDTEIHLLGDVYREENFGYTMRVAMEDHLEKGRVSTYNISNKGITFTGRSGIEYFYEYRNYEENYLAELYKTEVYVGDESKRRRELQESSATQ